MKKAILFFIITLISFEVAAQVPRRTNDIPVKYYPASTPYIWRYGVYDSVLKVPYGPNSVLREGGSDTSRPGALFYNTTVQKLQVWDGDEFLDVSTTSPNDTIIDNVYIGSLAGLRTNTRFIKFASIVDYGGGTFIKREGDNTSIDNTSLIVVDAAGVRYGRDWDGTTVQFDWNIPPNIVDGVDDVSGYIQATMNIAVDKKAQATKNRNYALANWVYLTRNISVDLNNANFSVTDNCKYSGSMFMFDPWYLDASTGKYTGTSNPATRKNPKTFERLEIFGGNIDLKNSYMGGIDVILTTMLSNCAIEKINIHNNIIKNFSRAAVRVLGVGSKTDSSSYISEVNIAENNMSYGYYNAGFCLDSAASAGDTTVYIRTMDGEPANNRYMQGRLVYFGSDRNNSTGLNTTGYSGTNQLFRIKRIRVSTTDSTRLALDITGGGYDATNGFTDSANGLRVNLLKNALMLPSVALINPLLFSLPPLSGTAGKFGMQRTTNTTAANTLGKNFYPGVKFQLPNNPGIYTVTAVFSNDSIQIYPAIRSTFTNVTPTILQQPGDCITYAGYIKKGKIDKNNFYCAYHALANGGYSGKGLFNEDLENKLEYTNNYSELMYMGVETTSNADVLSSLPTAAISTMSTIKGDSIIRFVNGASLLRRSTKDFDGDGIVEKFVTAVANNDAAATVKNSWIVGDILKFEGLTRAYKILEFPTDTTLKVGIWDQPLRTSLAPGLEASVNSVINARRIYTPTIGQQGCVYSFLVQGNYFKYNWGSYHLSTTAVFLNIFNNEFRDADKTFMELQGDEINVKNSNRFYGEYFDGRLPLPSLATRNAGPGRGVTLASLSGSRVTVDGNLIQGQLPDDYNNNPEHLSWSAGADIFSTLPPDFLKVTNNTFKGVKGRIAKPRYLRTVDGVVQPALPFSRYEFSNNNVSLANYYSNTGFYGNYFGVANKISNNIITKDGVQPISGPLLLFVAGQRPAPEILDSTGNYDITIAVNSYPKSQNINNAFPLSRMNYLDNDITLYLIGDPSGSTGEIGNKYVNTTTGKTWYKSAVSTWDVIFTPPTSSPSGNGGSGTKGNID